MSQFLRDFLPILGPPEKQIGSHECYFPSLKWQKILKVYSYTFVVMAFLGIFRYISTGADVTIQQSSVEWEKDQVLIIVAYPTTDTKRDIEIGRKNQSNTDISFSP